MTTIRTTASGQFKPDDLPDMEEDEVRSVTLNLAPRGTISSATVTCDTLTIGAPSVSSPNVTFTVTGDEIGTHHILASAVLSNGETVKGYIRAHVNPAPCSDLGGSDYRD
jgi:hypothetical protein